MFTCWLSKYILLQNSPELARKSHKKNLILHLNYFCNFDIIIHSYNIYKLFFLSFLPQINVISKKIWLSSTNKKKLLVKKIFFVLFTLLWTDRVNQIVPQQLEDLTFLVSMALSKAMCNIMMSALACQSYQKKSPKLFKTIRYKKTVQSWGKVGNTYSCNAETVRSFPAEAEIKPCFRSINSWFLTLKTNFGTIGTIYSGCPINFTQ